MTVVCCFLCTGGSALRLAPSTHHAGAWRGLSQCAMCSVLFALAHWWRCVASRAYHTACLTHTTLPQAQKHLGDMVPQHGTSVKAAPALQPHRHRHRHTHPHTCSPPPAAPTPGLDSAAPTPGLDSAAPSLGPRPRPRQRCRIAPAACLHACMLTSPCHTNPPQAQKHLDGFKAAQLLALLQLLAAWADQQQEQGQQQQAAAATGQYQPPAALLDAVSVRLRAKLAALVPEQVLAALAAFAGLGYRPDSQVRGVVVWWGQVGAWWVSQGESCAGVPLAAAAAAAAGTARPPAALPTQLLLLAAPPGRWAVPGRQHGMSRQQRRHATVTTTCCAATQLPPPAGPQHTHAGAVLAVGLRAPATACAAA